MASSVESPVVGTVWKVEAEVGDNVDVDDVIMILESMKMEIPVEAEVAGTIVSILVGSGDAVTEGDIVATIE